MDAILNRSLSFTVPRKARTSRYRFAGCYYVLLLGIITYYVMELVSKHRYAVMTSPHTFLVTNTFPSDTVLLPYKNYCNNPEIKFRSSSETCYNNASCVDQALSDRVTTEPGRISATLSYAGSDSNGCKGYFVPKSDVFFIFQHGFIHPETNEIYKTDECTVRATCTDPARCMERVVGREVVWKSENGDYGSSMEAMLAPLSVNYFALAIGGGVVLADFLYDSHRDWELGSKIKCYVNLRMLPGVFATGTPTPTVTGVLMNKAGNATTTAGDQEIVLRGENGQGRFLPMRVQFITTSSATIGVTSGYAVVMHLMSMTVMFGMAFTIVQFFVVRLDGFSDDVLDLDVGVSVLLPPTEPYPCNDGVVTKKKDASTHAELEKEEEMREALEAYRMAAKPLPRAPSFLP